MFVNNIIKHDFIKKQCLVHSSFYMWVCCVIYSNIFAVGPYFSQLLSLQRRWLYCKTHCKVFCIIYPTNTITELQRPKRKKYIRRWKICKRSAPDSTHTSINATKVILIHKHPYILGVFCWFHDNWYDSHQFDNLHKQIESGRCINRSKFLIHFRCISHFRLSQIHDNQVPKECTDLFDMGWISKTSINVYLEHIIVKLKIKRKSV